MQFGRQLAKVEKIGVGVEIDPSAQFVDVEQLEIGDHSYIGPNVRIIGGQFRVGEYSKIHSNCYIYPKNGIRLGHCTWIGQGTHLDGTGGISAGDFLGVGINSALYSHIRHGDVTEGCTLDKDGFLHIGSDVWFVGMCLVSPVTAADKSVALLGSTITKPMEMNHVYGGSPAVDLTHRMGAPWRERTVDEKIVLVETAVNHFFGEVRQDLDRSAIVVGTRMSRFEVGQTLYDVASRTYTKTNSETEVALNRWLFGYRAKFRPASQAVTND